MLRACVFLLLLAFALAQTPAPTSRVSADAINAFVTVMNGLQSTVILPNSTTFALDVRMFVDLFTNRAPMMIVYATSAQAVSQAVVFAAQNGLKVSVRSGGNSNLGWGTCTACVVVDVSRMTSIVTNLNAMPMPTVTVGPGVTNRMVIDQVSVLGLAVPTGDCPMVCLGGYTVGGGLSLASRLLGLNIDAVIEIEVVDPRGNILTANASTYADLFWALRGGSGINFGIVTSLKFQAGPLPPRMLGGYISYNLSLATQVASVYYDTIWGAGDTPDTWPFGFSLVFLTVNGANELRLYGLWYDANITRGQQVLAPFIALNYTANTITEGPFVDLMQPAMNQYLAFRGLNWTMPDAMIKKPSNKTEFVNFIGTVTSQAKVMPPLTFIAWVFAPLGGKFATIPSDATAFPHRSAGGNFHMPTVWFIPQGSAQVRKYGQDTLELLRPYYASQFPTNLIDPPSYVNHPSEYLSNYTTSYWGSNFARLLSIKKAFDPQNFYGNGQCIASDSGSCMTTPTPTPTTPTPTTPTTPTPTTNAPTQTPGSTPSAAPNASSEFGIKMAPFVGSLVGALLLGLLVGVFIPSDVLGRRSEPSDEMTAKFVPLNS